MLQLYYNIRSTRQTYSGAIHRKDDTWVKSALQSGAVLLIIGIEVVLSLRLAIADTPEIRETCPERWRPIVCGDKSTNPGCIVTLLFRNTHNLERNYCTYSEFLVNRLCCDEFDVAAPWEGVDLDEERPSQFLSYIRSCQTMRNQYSNGFLSLSAWNGISSRLPSWMNLGWVVRKALRFSSLYLAGGSCIYRALCLDIVFLTCL